jgi:hypothetical protein
MYSYIVQNTFTFTIYNTLYNVRETENGRTKEAGGVKRERRYKEEHRLGKNITKKRIFLESEGNKVVPMLAAK